MFDWFDDVLLDVVMRGDMVEEVEEGYCVEGGL